MRENVSTKTNRALIGVNAPLHTLQRALRALGNGKISEVLGAFDDRFTFKDEALDLDFTDTEHLGEFFRKSRELFPDTVLEVLSTFECGDHAIAEWKINATETVGYGSIQLQSPISFQGISVVHVENGRIICWSDYYDQGKSRRIKLAAFFTEWVEY